MKFYLSFILVAYSFLSCTPSRNIVGLHICYHPFGYTMMRLRPDSTFLWYDILPNFSAWSQRGWGRWRNSSGSVILTFDYDSTKVKNPHDYAIVDEKEYVYHIKANRLEGFKKKRSLPHFEKLENDEWK